MNGIKYQQIDISGDVGLRVLGRTPEELLGNAAAGMSDLITDMSKINETVRREVSLTSDFIENLLIQWLNELIFLFDTYGFIGKTFSVGIRKDLSSPLLSEATEKKIPLYLRAKISGGIFDAAIHERRLLIKAATYHNISVKKVDTFYEAIVIFDI